ncbi:MAG TPA: 30S ribosomal protein S16 [Candidatus Krumholzibacteria bacterium]|nr:30S ribosomal protein S16 [Candidatus Krumholzibacteria bacterium]
MSVKIRLKRMGTKKRPFYRIVATDSRNRRDGRFIEELGYYDPLTTPPNIKLEEERIFQWLKNGAIPSTNVESLMRRMGTMKKWVFVRDGVATDEVDAKVAALADKETKGLTADERRHKYASKKVSKKKAAAAGAPAAEGA